MLRRERLVTRSGHRVRVPVSTGNAADVEAAGAASPPRGARAFQRSAICSRRARKSWCRLPRSPSARKARASPATSRCRWAAVSGLHADREPYRSVAQDRIGRRAPAAEAHRHERAPKRATAASSYAPPRRMREKTNCGPIFAFSRACGTTSRTRFRGFEATGADLSRSQRSRARAARPGHISDFSVIWVDTEPSTSAFCASSIAFSLAW